MADVTVLVLAVLSGYFVGFIAHHISKCGRNPDVVIVSMPAGASPKEAAAFLRKTTTEMRRRGYDGRLDHLCGLVLEVEGAIYTPTTLGNKASARFMRAADLCDELEDAFDGNAARSVAKG